MSGAGVNQLTMGTYEGLSPKKPSVLGGEAIFLWRIALQVLFLGVRGKIEGEKVRILIQIQHKLQWRSSKDVSH